MILIYNGLLVTRDENNKVIEDGALVLDGKYIKEVGKTSDLISKYEYTDKIDAKKGLIMPGLVNDHMHYYSTFARGISLDGPSPMNFVEILETLWWRIDKKLTLEDVYYSTLTQKIEEIKGGVTSVIDHHASPYAIRGSLQEIHRAGTLAGTRANLCYELSDRDGAKTIDEGIEENIEFMKYANSQKNDMIKGLFGLHASMTLSDDTLKKAVKEVDKIDGGFHVHVAEGIADLNDSISKYNKTVVERYRDLEVAREKSLFIHCVHVNDKDIDILKDTKVSVVTNPESNMGNAVGSTPVRKIFDRGIQIGLGTDGYTTDMFESYKTLNCLLKHEAGIPSVGWGEPPAMLFGNNKDIFNKYIDDKVGVLESGYLADVIIVDYSAPTPIDASNINGHLLFGVGGRNVDTTICNGKILMKDRILTSLDDEKIFAESRKVSKEFWSRV